MEMLVQEEVSVTMTLHGHQEEGRHGAIPTALHGGFSAVTN